LLAVYPEYQWLPWKFDISPRNFWGNVENQRKFVEFAAKQLKIKDLSDWYNVTHKAYIAVTLPLIKPGIHRYWWWWFAHKIYRIYFSYYFNRVSRLRLVTMEICNYPQELFF
jgi:hypothetical protein